MVRIGPIELGEFPLLLAPMEDVSDPPFRALCKKHGADLMYTEFISSEGLIRRAAKGMKKLDIFENERPVGIQLFGGSEDAMEEAARIAEEVRPDLIDINYGCPVCLLYTSDAADERSSVDLGGRRIIKKKNSESIMVHITTPR